jgi:hypothetical protein
MKPGPIDQAYIDERRGVVDSAPSGRRKPLREPPYCRIIGEARRNGLQALSAVDVDLFGAVDQDVSHTRQTQQWFEGTGADRVATQRINDC